MSISGISFYDFLGKSVTGILLLGLLLPISTFVDLIFIQTVVYSVIAYLLGMIWDKAIRVLSRPLRKNRFMLSLSYNRYIKAHRAPNLISTEINERYDEAYFLLMRHDMLGTIPKQEAHENFLRNIWLVLLLYTLRIMMCCECCGHSNSCFINETFGLSCQYYQEMTWLLLFLMTAIPTVWWIIQMQIYFTVWDNTSWTLFHTKHENEQLHNNESRRL